MGLGRGSEVKVEGGLGDQRRKAGAALGQVRARGPKVAGR